MTKSIEPYVIPPIVRTPKSPVKQFIIVSFQKFKSKPMKTNAQPQKIATSVVSKIEFKIFFIVSYF